MARQRVFPTRLMECYVRAIKSGSMGFLSISKTTPISDQDTPRRADAAAARG